jgi:hypothetical protein
LPETRNAIYQYIVQELPETMQIFDMDGQPLEYRNFAVAKAFSRNQRLYQELFEVYLSSSFLEVSAENFGIFENPAIFKNELISNLRIKVPYVVTWIYTR